MSVVAIRRVVGKSSYPGLWPPNGIETHPTPLVPHYSTSTSGKHRPGAVTEIERPRRLIRGRRNHTTPAMLALYHFWKGGGECVSRVISCEPTFPNPTQNSKLARDGDGVWTIREHHVEVCSTQSFRIGFVFLFLFLFFFLPSPISLSHDPPHHYYLHLMPTR